MVKKEVLKALNSKNLERSIEINLTRNDSDASFKAVFTTSAPYTRSIDGFVFDEVLRCAPENVDLTRVNSENGASFLYNHVSGDLIGKATDAVAEGERVTGRVTFDKEDSRGADMLAKFKRGMLTKLSVGYNVLDGDVVYPDDEKALPIFYVKQWAMNELSAAPVPADFESRIIPNDDTRDDEAGGEKKSTNSKSKELKQALTRAIESGEYPTTREAGDLSLDKVMESKNMTVENTENVEQTPGSSVAKTEVKANTAELKRDVVEQRASIKSDDLATMFGIEKNMGLSDKQVVLDYIEKSDNPTVQGFVGVARTAHEAKRAATPLENVHLKNQLPAKDAARVNANEAYTDFVAGRALKGAAGEEQQELIRNGNLETGANEMWLSPSLMASAKAKLSGKQTRAGNSTFAEGAALVDTKVTGIIEALGPRMWSGTVGIDTHNSPSMAIVQEAVITDNDSTLIVDGKSAALNSTGTLTGLKWMPSNILTNNYQIGLVMQGVGAFDYETIVNNRMMVKLGEDLDKLMMTGVTGTPSFAGINTETGLKNVGSTTDIKTASWSVMNDALGNLQGSNYDLDSVWWVIHTAAAKVLRSTLIGTPGSDRYILRKNELAEYPVVVTNSQGAQLDGTAANRYAIATAIIPGSYQYVQFGGLKLIIDNYTQSGSGSRVLRLFSVWDAKLRRKSAAVNVFIKVA